MHMARIDAVIVLAASRATEWARTLLASAPDPGPTIARVLLGTGVLIHSARNMLGPLGAGGLEAYASLDTPVESTAPVIMLAIAVELAGAVALLAGFLSRVTAFLVAAAILVGVGIVDLPSHHLIAVPDERPEELSGLGLVALGLAAIIILRGGGAGSLDRALARRMQRRIQTKEECK